MGMGEVSKGYHRWDVVCMKFGIWANKIRDKLDKISF